MSWRSILRRSSSIFLFTGVLLLLMMIWVEREPGGISLVLIALGSVGLVLSKPPSGSA
ncbi:MAG: hypothetical protein AAGI27_17615 [Pseudomonadota bacterium]